VRVSSPPQPTAATSALEPQDRALVDACLAGTPGAWDQFVDRFAGLLAFVADRTARQRGIALSPADRDDLVAETLVALIRKDAAALRAFAGRASLPTYLVVIARRVAVRLLPRQAGGDAWLRPSTAARRRAEPLAVDTRDEAARIADREHVETLLGALDGDEARLVRLHHLEQRSYGEISHLTGMPLGSIGPALSRAREKMRRLDEHPQAG
jgi:RNA polymerase sigma-70 factor, ECF subfamily